MANFYFEINDSLADKWHGSKYFMTNKDTVNFAQISENLSQCSDRIWCEQQGQIWFAKHDMDPTAEVDLKEFMWIKLKAQNI